MQGLAENAKATLQNAAGRLDHVVRTTASEIDGTVLDLILVRGQQYHVLEQVGEGAYSVVLKCQEVFRDSPSPAAPGLQPPHPPARPGTQPRAGHTAAPAAARPGQQSTGVTLAHGYRRGKVVAVKRMAVSKDNTQRAHDEIELTEALDHPNILRCHGAEVTRVQGQLHAALVFDFCPHGTLLTHMQRAEAQRQFFSEGFVVHTAGQIAAAVCHLHYMMPDGWPVSHWDLKPENVLLAEDRSTWRLADFGSASREAFHCHSNGDVQRVTDSLDRFTTMQYRSPEMVDLWRRQRCDTQADVWAFGVLLYYAMYLRLPFPDTRLGVLQHNIAFPAPGSALDTAAVNTSTQFQAEASYSATLVGILKRCLVPDPTVRWSMRQVLKALHLAYPAIVAAPPAIVLAASISGDGDSADGGDDVRKQPLSAMTPEPVKPATPTPPTGGTATAAVGLFSMLQWEGGQAPPPAAAGQVGQQSTPQPRAQAPVQRAVVKSSQCQAVAPPVASAGKPQGLDLFAQAPTSPSPPQASIAAPKALASPAPAVDLFAAQGPAQASQPCGPPVDLFAAQCVPAAAAPRVPAPMGSPQSSGVLSGNGDRPSAVASAAVAASPMGSGVDLFAAQPAGSGTPRTDSRPQAGSPQSSPQVVDLFASPGGATQPPVAAVAASTPAVQSHLAPSLSALFGPSAPSAASALPPVAGSALDAAFAVGPSSTSAAPPAPTTAVSAAVDVFAAPATGGPQPANAAQGPALALGGSDKGAEFLDGFQASLEKEKARRARGL